ncbi:MAG: hypothetical protein FWD23_12150 [Oscillospiraceae bacterium]|nr:hypothetical protein [Oscillospiraceae bacterium]
MKKMFLLFIAISLLVSLLTMTVGAAGIEKWLTFYHEERQMMPMLEESPGGLIVNIANYTHTPDDSDETTRFGIVYNEKIKLDGFKIEFDIRRSPVGGDAWIALNFFNNPLPMWHDNPESTSGFISLIRPANEEEIGFEGYQSTVDNTFSGTGRLAVEVADVTNCTLIVEVKRQADGYYFYMNGEEHPGVHDDLLALFSDDMAYLEITTYCSGEEDHAYELLIKSINGQPVVWEEVIPEPEPEPEPAPEPAAPAEVAPAPAETPPPVAAPTTGDAATVIFFGMTAAAGAFLLALKKRVQGK